MLSMGWMKRYLPSFLTNVTFPKGPTSSSIRSICTMPDGVRCFGRLAITSRSSSDQSPLRATSTVSNSELLSQGRGIIPAGISHLCRGRYQDSTVWARSQHSSDLTATETCRRYEGGRAFAAVIRSDEPAENIGDVHPHIAEFVGRFEPEDR